MLMLFAQALTKAGRTTLPPFSFLTGDVHIARDTASGEIVTNIPQEVVHHSPDGFEAGYGGSGPADFALNILHQYVPVAEDRRFGGDGEPVKCFRGQCSSTAWRLHQAFKRQFIAPLNVEAGEQAVIRGCEIRAWIDRETARNERGHKCVTRGGENNA